MLHWGAHIHALVCECMLTRPHRRMRNPHVRWCGRGEVVRPPPLRRRRAASRTQITLEPCHTTRPAVFGCLWAVTLTVVGMEGMPGIGVDDHFHVLVMLF